MIVPSNTFLRIVDWIAQRIGLNLGLPEDITLDSFDEREIADQLRYGRD
jgi:hypothetical protein